MEKTQATRYLNDYIAISLFIALYYFSYRYPLQINSSTTSPTYSDTPFVLQALKYIAILGLAAVYFIKASTANQLKGTPSSTGSMPTIAAILLCYPFAVGIITYLIDGKGENWIINVTDSTFFIVVLFPLFLLHQGKPDMDRVSRYLVIFFHISIAITTIQFFLYWTTGRLPALAWEGSLSVRFGSLWDDPNGYPMVLALLVPLLLYRSTQKLFSAYVVVSTIVIITLAQSLTCLSALFVGFLATYFVNSTNQQRLTQNLLKTMFFGLIGYFVYEYVVDNDVFQIQSTVSSWYLEKQASIQARQALNDAFYSIDLTTLLGFTPANIWGESAWINIIINFGIFYLIFYAFFLLTGISYTLKLVKHGEPHYRGLYLGMFCFMVAYGVSMFNIPNNRVFPVNILFYLVWGLAFVQARHTIHPEFQSSFQQIPAKKTA